MATTHSKNNIIIIILYSIMQYKRYLPDITLHSQITSCMCNERVDDHDELKNISRNKKAVMHSACPELTPK